MNGDLVSADAFLPRENHDEQRAAEAQNEDHNDPESVGTPLDQVVIGTQNEDHNDPESVETPLLEQVAIGTRNEEHNDQELANGVSWETLPMLRETAF
jgi:hypothetical protein